MPLPSVINSESPIRIEPRFQHSYVRVDGVRLHYATLGEPSRKTPLVLLHGLNDSHLAWKRVAPALASDRRVFMPDLPGSGLSDRPDASYELGWHAKMIEKWLDRMGLEKVDLVGHSFGGGVAQRLLLDCPERIRRLVLVAPGGLGSEISLALRLASLPGVVELLGQRFMAFGTRLALRKARASLSERDLDELGAMNGVPGSARAFARTVRDVIDWRGQRRTFFERAHELGAMPPIAVCWGDRDPIIPVAHGAAFAEAVDGVLFKRFEGAGHYVHDEQPEAFARTVRDFLDDPGIRPARLKKHWGLREESRTLAVALPRGLPSGAVVSEIRGAPSTRASGPLHAFVDDERGMHARAADVAQRKLSHSTGRSR